MTFFEQLEDDIKARFNDQVVPLLPDNTPVIYDNQKEIETEPKPDIRIFVNILPGRGFQAEFGHPSTYRHPGAIIVRIFGRLHVGKKDLNQIVDLVYNVFVDNPLDSNIHYRTPYPENIGPNTQYTDWWQVNLVCPYFADDRR